MLVVISSKNNVALITIYHFNIFWRRKKKLWLYYCCLVSISLFFFCLGRKNHFSAIQMSCCEYRDHRKFQEEQMGPFLISRSSTLTDFSSRKIWKAKINILWIYIDTCLKSVSAKPFIWTRFGMRLNKLYLVVHQDCVVKSSRNVQSGHELSCARGILCQSKCQCLK